MSFGVMFVSCIFCPGLLVCVRRERAKIMRENVVMDDDDKPCLPSFPKLPAILSTKEILPIS